jgi:phosphatidylglycerophosphate synthase
VRGDTGVGSGLIEGYRRSLKAIEVEEWLDLVLYRPLAYLLVLGIHRTPVTPNSMTLLAAISGVAAGVWVGTGTGDPFWGPPLLLFLYNVLDCGDGMLARLQGSGSRFGRVLDGIADYLVMGTLYLGIGAGLSAGGSPPLRAWGLTIAAGLSTTFHAMLVDFYRGRFLDHLLQRVSPPTNDHWLHSRYAALQKMLVSGRAGSPDRQGGRGGSYVEENRRIMRGWTFLGPTTELSILIAGLLTAQLEAALWVIVVPGNLLALLLRHIQGRITPLDETGKAPV